MASVPRCKYFPFHTSPQLFITAARAWVWQYSSCAWVTNYSTMAANLTSLTCINTTSGFLYQHVNRAFVREQCDTAAAHSAEGGAGMCLDDFPLPAVEETQPRTFRKTHVKKKMRGRWTAIELSDLDVLFQPWSILVYWYFSGFPLLIDGFVAHIATPVLIIIMTFPNGLWAEDSTLMILALVTYVQDENVFALTFCWAFCSDWVLARWCAGAGAFVWYDPSS